MSPTALTVVATTAVRHGARLPRPPSSMPGPPILPICAPAADRAHLTGAVVADDGHQSASGWFALSPIGRSNRIAAGTSARRARPSRYCSSSHFEVPSPRQPDAHRPTGRGVNLVDQVEWIEQPRVPGAPRCDTPGTPSPSTRITAAREAEAAWLRPSALDAVGRSRGFDHRWAEARATHERQGERFMRTASPQAADRRGFGRPVAPAARRCRRDGRQRSERDHVGLAGLVPVAIAKTCPHRRS